MISREKGHPVRKRKLWMIPVFATLLFCAIFLVYTGQYYHSDATAYAALQSDETVAVTKTEYGWLFDGQSGSRHGAA